MRVSRNPYDAGGLGQAIPRGPGEVTTGQSGITQEISMATGLQATQWMRTAGEERGKERNRKGERAVENYQSVARGEDLRHQETTDNRPVFMDQVNKVAGKAR